MLLLHPIRWNYKSPWHLCNFDIIFLYFFMLSCLINTEKPRDQHIPRNLKNRKQLQKAGGRGGLSKSVCNFPEIHPCWLLPFAVFFRASDISGKSSVFHVSPTKMSKIIKHPPFRIGEIQEKLKRDPRQSKERPKRHGTKDSFCCCQPVWPPHLWGWPDFTVTLCDKFNFLKPSFLVSN